MTAKVLVPPRMPAGSIKTEAVVLRTLRYGEADRILHLYTPHRGRVAAIAKGVRRAKSRFGGRLEPYFRLQMVLYEGRSELLTVTSADTITGHAAAARARPRARQRRARVRRRLAPVRDRRSASWRVRAAVQRAGAARRRAPSRRRTPTSSRSASSCCSPPASRRSSPPAPSCGEADHLAAFSGAAGGVVCSACEATGFRLGEEAHAFMTGALGAALADAPAAGELALRQAERAIAETVEHHAHVRWRAAFRRRDSVYRIARHGSRSSRYEVGVRLRRGLTGDAQPPRRQGRERRRNDAHPGRRPRPSRVHDHDGGLRHVHGAGASRSPMAWTGRSTKRSPGWRSTAGKTLGDPDDPLLVSVRSGARESMPGMLDTVLNLGLNDASVAGLAEKTGNERFAWDSYRRFVQMFGNVVRDIPGEQLRDRRSRRPSRSTASRWTPSSTSPRCKRSPRASARSSRRRPARTFPQQPRDQLDAGDPRGLRLLGRRPRRRLPAHQPHPRRLGHGGQRPADGLRQQGRHARAPASPSAATRSTAHPSRRATSSSTPRARTSSPACATPRTSPTCATSCPRRTRRSWRSCARSRRTTRTCRTRSSRSRKAVCTCCRRATPSARRRPACASPATASTRVC